jgi:hypothetical protein
MSPKTLYAKWNPVAGNHTWTAVTDSTIGTDTITAIAYGNGKFVAVILLSIYDGFSYSNGGKMTYSTDGMIWTTVTNSTFGTNTNGTSDINAIAYGNNMFLAGGGGGHIAYLLDD